MNEAKNKVKVKLKNSLETQKKIYIALLVVALLGLVLGSIYAIILSDSDHTLVRESLNAFFTDIDKNNINYGTAFINSLIGNTVLTLLIWFLGISIIGIPIIFIFNFFKVFILGFSISSIIYTYHVKGIIYAISYIFPHQIIAILITIFLSFYAVYFSKRLFCYLFLKHDINLKHGMKRYTQVLLISLAILVLCSAIEVFLSPVIMKLFY